MPIGNIERRHQLRPECLKHRIRNALARNLPCPVSSIPPLLSEAIESSPFVAFGSDKLHIGTTEIEPWRRISTRWIVRGVDGLSYLRDIIGKAEFPFRWIMTFFEPINDIGVNAL